MSHLSTAYGLFLVSFRGVSEQFIFNSENEVLGNLVAEQGKHGIIFVKRFQPSKGNFKTMPKAEIINSFSWDTYTTEQLKKINFIKK
jgi:hypothetical protein